MARTMWGLCLVLIALVVSQDRVNAEFWCSQAVSKLMPCLPFLMDSAYVTAPCCQGAQALNSMAVTKPVRQLVCQCLKQAAQTFTVDPARARQIPQLCNINLSVVIDPNVNCANVN